MPLFPPGSRRDHARTVARGVHRRATGRLVDQVLGLPPGAGGFQVEYDLAVTMRDGAVLLGDRYLPDAPQWPGPVVLIRLPYGRRGLIGVVYGRTLARHGFAVFIQSTRGTFGSGGQFRPFTTEHEDGLDTVAWLRAQPWCDGRIAMTGGSYLGHTQWAVAPYADPPLTCVAPHITAARISAIFYEHGVPELQNALEWSAQIGRQEAHPSWYGLLPNPLAKARVAQASRRLPLQAADVTVTGAPVAFWRDFVAHADPDDRFWDVCDHSGADLSTMPPTLMVTGWWDLFIRDQLKDYTRLRAAGVSARLLVGPWLHGEPAEIRATLSADVEWLAHHLHNGPPPPGAPVRVALMPSGGWLDLDTWPPAAQTRSLHLHPQGGLADRPPVGAAGATAFGYDPTDPTPSVGGPLLNPPGKQVDNTVLEARPDVLTFTGPVLTRDLDVVGPVTASIFVRTRTPYTDLFVRLTDVDEQGVSRNVVDGISRLDPECGVPIDDAGVARVELELFPTAYRFAAGHRLRVQVSGGAFPRHDRNHGTPGTFGAATTLRGNRIEVLHDAAHPSRLDLPVFLG